MRIGVFSDVHSNLQALQKTLEAMEEQRLDRYVCLGDVVGYGASPNECATLVREVVRHSLLGNHDAAVTGRMDYSYYYDQAKQALDWSAEVLCKENMEWLSKVPYAKEDEELGLCFCHGSPISPEEFDYIFNLDQARDAYEYRDTMQRVTFIGHSHLCRVFAMDEEGVVQMVPGRVEIEQDRQYVISVGSVGQPRDYDPRAAFGVFDTDTQVFEQHRVEYDVKEAARGIYEAGLPDAFGKRLFVGV